MVMAGLAGEGPAVRLEGGAAGSGGGDGQAGTGRWSAPGGRGSGAALPRIPGLTLAPGRGGQPNIWKAGGGGGVTVNGEPEPEWRAEQSCCGQGFGGGVGGRKRTNQVGGNGIVIIYG